MKKIYAITLAALLTFCGANMMAALLALTAAEEYVSTPSPLAVKAGETVTVPVSLTNTNTGFVAFQMDITLPEGVSPVLNSRGKVAVTKSARLDESHSISTSYNETTRTIKMVCTSLENALITGTEGELFYFDLQAADGLAAGEYTVTLNGIQFSTSSTAPEGAVTYYMPETTAVIAVEGEQQPVEEPTKAVTVFVEADMAPYLYAWTDNGSVNGEWPGTVMNDQVIVKDRVFWRHTFSGYETVNIIFNNGNGSQTAEITGVTGDKYFTYDGAVTYDDITSVMTAEGAENMDVLSWFDSLNDSLPVSELTSPVSLDGVVYGEIELNQAEANSVKLVNGLAMAAFNPTETKADATVDFVVTPENPESYQIEGISFLISKMGSDTGTLTVEWVDANSNATTLISGQSINRNNEASGWYSTFQLTRSAADIGGLYTISYNNVSTEISTATPLGLDGGRLRITVSGMSSTKQFGLANVKIMSAPGEAPELTPFNQSYDEATEADWTNSVSGRYTPVVSDGYLTVNQAERNNNGCVLTSTMLAGHAPARLDFTLTFDAKLSNGSNQVSTFTIYDAANANAMLSLTATGAAADTWSINGMSETVALPNSSKCNSKETINDVKWVTVKLTRFGELTFLTILNRETAEPVFAQSLIAGSSAKGGLGKMEFKTGRYFANFAIDNINVRAIEDGDVPQVVMTTCTVLTIGADSLTLREPVVFSGVAGSEVKVPDALKAPFYSADSTKYYLLDSATSLVATEDSAQNIVTLKFREAGWYTYTLNATYNAYFLTCVASGADFESKTIDVPYSYMLNVNGRLYKTTQKSTPAHYVKNMILTQNGQQTEIAYEDAGKDNVVFFAEAEKIPGMLTAQNDIMKIRSSNAACGYATEKTAITRLPAGTYILGGAYSMSTKIDSLYFFADDALIAQVAPTGRNNWIDFEDTVKISKTSQLYFRGGNSDNGLDFLYIQRAYDDVVDFSKYYDRSITTWNGNDATFNFGGEYVYNYSGEYAIDWSSGESYTLTSEKPISAVDFTFLNSVVPSGLQASTGEMSGSKWIGNATSITFTHSDNSQSYFNPTKIGIIYDAATLEELIERLTAQLDDTDSALVALNYSSVQGADFLRATVASLRGSLEADTLTDETAIRNYVNSVKSQTTAVVALDLKYVTLENTIKKCETTIANNSHVGQTWLTEFTTYAADVRAGLAEGRYSDSEANAVINRLNSYYAPVLAEAIIVVDIQEAGTLGDSILAQVENFRDVIGLTVSGHLNSTDLSNLKSRLTSVKYLDLAATDLTSIPSEQFYEWSQLKNIVLPERLTTIGSYAFYGCTNLQNFTMPATLRTIGEYAFYNHKAITEFVVPEGVTTIGEYAFYSSSTWTYDENGNHVITGSALKSVSLPSTLSTLDSYAFAGNLDLQTVTIADGLQSISSYVFQDCSALTDLRLPATLTSIGTNAFFSCSALTSVELPEGLTSIGNQAFANCSKLQSAVLPSTLQSVSMPFYSCNNLKAITLKAVVPPSLSSSVMGGNEGQCTLTVPNLSVNVYKQTSYWDAFNIVGADILPDNIIVKSSHKISWPDSLGIDYKPYVRIENSGKLEVTGQSTLSASWFDMVWDPNISVSNGRVYNSITGNYEYKRDAYASLINKANVRADNVTIQLWTRTNMWDFISIPFDVKVGDIRLAYEGTPFVIRKYDGQKRAEGLMDDTWVTMTADSTLHAGQGYILQSASTDDNRGWNGFYLDALQNVNKNRIFASGDVELPLAYHASEFAHNLSWNLVGNPYPCYFDIRAIETTSPIIVWNAYNSNYDAYSPADDAYILNPGQAFFVQRPVDAESITFLKEGRQQNTTVRSTDYLANRAAKASERSVFNVSLTGNELGDHTRFVINAAATTDYDNGRDAAKFMSTDERAAQLYTLADGVRYAINERPLADGIVELGLAIGSEGNYTLALMTDVDNEVYLIDRQNGTEVRLDATTGYEFYAEAGTIEGRFAIRLGGGDVTGIKAIDDSQIYDLPIYDLGGRKMVNSKSVNGQLQRGLYIKNGKKVVVK